MGIYFTGDYGYQKFLVFPQGRCSIILYKKVTNWTIKKVTNWTSTVILSKKNNVSNV